MGRGYYPAGVTMALVWHDLGGDSTINNWNDGGWQNNLSRRLTLLKKTLLSAGWTVVVCGDGTTKSIGTDNTGSFTVDNTWIYLQDPGGGRCIGLQRTAAYQVTVKYVATGGIDTSTGSGSTMSSALTSAEDKTIVNNVTVDYDNAYMNCVADNASPYGFYLICALGTATTGGFNIIFDPLTNANASDTDPCVIYVHRGNYFNWLYQCFCSGNPQVNAGGAMAWKWRDAGSESWTGCNTLPWAYQISAWDDNYFLFPYNTGVDFTRGKEVVAPLWWGDQNYIKGKSTMAYWRGAGYNNFATFQVSTVRDRIVWGPLALRWVGEKAAV